jgi:hypothetical protein
LFPIALSAFLCKNSISCEIRATKTYQAVKLGPLSWEMKNPFFEKMLSMYKTYLPYHVFSFSISSI